MKDKSFFKRLRLLMAAGSIISFAGGWALLANAYPVTTEDTATVAQVITVSPTNPVSATVTNSTVQPTSTATAPPTTTVTPLVQITTAPTATTITSSQTRLRTGGS